MKTVRLSLIVLSMFLMLAIPGLAFGTPASPAATEHNFVRVPAAAMDEVGALALSPLASVNYGSFHWLELNKADFATLSASSIRFTRVTDGGTLDFMGYRFDPVAQGEPSLPAGLRASESAVGLRLVQLAGPTKAAWLSQLEATGVRVLQYYPGNAFLVWDASGASAAVGSLDFVRWQGAFHPAYKIDASLEKRTGLVNNVDVMFYNDGNVQGTLAALAALGGNVVQAYPAQPDEAFFNAIVQLPAEAVANVALLDTVLWLGYQSPAPILDDEMSSQIVAGNYSNAGVPFPGYFDWLADVGFDGSGVTWAIIDTGVDYDHPDLASHIVGGHDFPGACVSAGEPGSDCSNGGHGTHVAGIVGGDATAGFSDSNGYLYGLGVAPEYGIFAMNSLSAVAWPPAGGWQEHSKRAVLGGAVGGNNSWTTGEGTNHGYQASERTHDIMVLDGNFDTTSVAEPFIEVFSAGNSGPGPLTLTAPKEGKNLIITASSKNYRIGNINDISSFSSRGPAADGRWVPTITAPGEQIASSANDLGGACASPIIGGTNGLYAYCSGTSMAAPHASGAIAVATEWWRASNGGADLSPAMAKALLVNTAEDMGTADIPNANEGWGRVRLDRIVADEDTAKLYFDQTTLFNDTGDSWSISVGVLDPSKPLKVTIAWSDAPGAVGANPALVNNLDLTVENGGNSYLGNVFSGGWSMTGGTADLVNNLENVFIQAPGGSATITVDAASISGDAILYAGDTTDQSFALICSNCALNPDFTLEVEPATLDICIPDDASYEVMIGSILGYNDLVTLDVENLPAGTVAGFSNPTVTPPGSSLLTIDTNNASAGSYQIDVIGVAATSTHTATVGLNLFAGVPSAPILLAPANGATGVGTSPTLEWEGSDNSVSYSVVLATDPFFNDIVESASGLVGTSYQVQTVLDPVTTYYWRVQADNVCGTGAVSEIFSFRTGNIVCQVIDSTDVPKPIGPNGGTNTYSDVDVSTFGEVQDVNVLDLAGTHTWVADLTMYLLSPLGTEVQLRPQSCGSEDNFDINYDDEAAPGEPPCPPTDGGTYQPMEPLSTFDGEEANGTWTLRILDNANGDSGTLNSWSLQLCSVGEEELPDLEISKSEPEGTLQPGETITYTISVTNTGSTEATGLVVTDTLNGDAVVVPGPDTLAPDEVGVYLFDYTIQPDDCGTDLVNQAEVTDDTGQGATLLIPVVTSIVCAPTAITVEALGGTTLPNPWPLRLLVGALALGVTLGVMQRRRVR